MQQLLLLGGERLPRARRRRLAGFLREGRNRGKQDEQGEEQRPHDCFVPCGGGGAGHATIWTCDLSKEYVTINADYHT